MLWCAAIAATAAVTLCGLYLAHISTLASFDLGGTIATAGRSASKVAGGGDLFPGWETLKVGIAQNPFAWIAIIGGGAAALVQAYRSAGRERWVWASIAGFGSILACLAIYRNAFPYFYVFLLPPAAVLAAVGADRILGPHGRLGLFAGLMGASALLHTGWALTRSQDAQRVHVDAVHAIFPQPVAYIDRCSMIASFPKSGPFLSTWSLESYRSAERPIFREILLRDRPSFLLANSPILLGALTGAGSSTGLLDADAAILRGNFIPHWGEMWVPGKVLQLKARASSPFEVLVSGRYTVESTGPVMIDGTRYNDGDFVDLPTGRHEARGGADQAVLVLRLGEDLPVPKAAAPEEPTFTYF
jgi:hypothetical protein